MTAARSTKAHHMTRDDEISAVREYLILAVERRIGEARAITAVDLLFHLHASIPVSREIIPNTRKLLEMIHELRRNSVVIASCSRGYFTPANAEEAHRYIKDVLQSRAVDLFVTIRAQRQAIFNTYGRQLTMDLRK